MSIYYHKYSSSGSCEDTVEAGKEGLRDDVKDWKLMNTHLSSTNISNSFSVFKKPNIRDNTVINLSHNNEPKIASFHQTVWGYRNWQLDLETSKTLSPPYSGVTLTRVSSVGSLCNRISIEWWCGEMEKIKFSQSFQALHPKHFA